MNILNYLVMLCGVALIVFPAAVIYTVIFTMVSDLNEVLLISAIATALALAIASGIYILCHNL